MIKQATRRGPAAAPLAGMLRDAIMRLNRRMRQARPLGDLTLTQISALTSLGLAGALTPRELAEAERVQPPTMTRKVNFLEEGGYVLRRPHETDGRVVVVTLTEQGRARVVADRKRRDEWLSRQLRDLTAAERDVLRAAAPILQRLSERD